MGYDYNLDLRNLQKQVNDVLDYFANKNRNVPFSGVSLNGITYNQLVFIANALFDVLDRDSKNEKSNK